MGLSPMWILRFAPHLIGAAFILGLPCTYANDQWLAFPVHGSTAVDYIKSNGTGSDPTRVVTGGGYFGEPLIIIAGRASSSDPGYQCYWYEAEGKACGSLIVQVSRSYIDPKDVPGELSTAFNKHDWPRYLSLLFEMCGDTTEFGIQEDYLSLPLRHKKTILTHRLLRSRGRFSIQYDQDTGQVQATMIQGTLRAR